MARRSPVPPRPALAEYEAKRDFARTPEPSGRDGGRDGERPGGMFVVQRHRARRLHYDLRLEVDGVLASWAVPKGPTIDPRARRLAVHAEDHPMEYADFEGVIPSREYGGGDVIVWDHGTWAPSGTDDPAAAIRSGDLHFDLWGEKLAGRFVLVRRNRDRGGREQWLLLHKNDEHARPGWDPEDHPASVVSGRTNDDVAAAPAALWRSDLPAAEAKVAVGAAPGGLPADDIQGGWAPPTPGELAALDAMEDAGRWSVQGRRVALSRLDGEVLAGREGGRPVTRRELVRYLASMAPVLQPYLAGRAVTVGEAADPDDGDPPGAPAGGLPSRTPQWLHTWAGDPAGTGDPGPRNAATGQPERHAVPDGPAALAWLANLGAVALRPWLSSVDRPAEPAWALFAIRPGAETTLDDMVALARLHRAALDHLGIAGCPLVDGSRGLQVWVPVRPGYSFATTRAWAGQVAASIAATVPDLVAGPRRGGGDGRARLDTTVTAPGPTPVAPYGVRARAGAPVAVPVGWDELDDPDLRPDRWTVRTVGRRLAERGDPLAGLVGLPQHLPPL
jgi:bifunctional non-homologous end joining protein LigD